MALARMPLLFLVALRASALDTSCDAHKSSRTDCLEEVPPAGSAMLQMTKAQQLQQSREEMTGKLAVPGHFERNAARDEAFKLANAAGFNANDAMAVKQAAFGLVYGIQIQVNTDAMASGFNPHQIYQLCHEAGQQVLTASRQAKAQAEAQGLSPKQILQQYQAAAQQVQQVRALCQATARALGLNSRQALQRAQAAGADPQGGHCTTSTTTTASTTTTSSTANASPATTSMTPLPATTSMTQPAVAGATVIEVSDTNGFHIGQHVIFGSGTSFEESNVIAGFSSIILQYPLKYSHAAGSSISAGASTSAGATAGSTNPLNELGYQQTAALCCHHEMSLFVKRVIASLGHEVCDISDLHGLVHWYDCTNDASAYAELLGAIQKGTGGPCPWLGSATFCPVKGSNCKEPFPPCPTTFDPQSEPGISAALSQTGYSKVALRCCDTEMKDYMLREIQRQNLDICDQGGLNGLIHWYDCTNDDQTYDKLVRDIAQAHSGGPCPWLAAKGQPCPARSHNCPVVEKDPPVHRRRTACR